MLDNPFTPEFGVVPDVMAGRTDLLAQMRHAFAAQRRDPNLTSIFIGACGTGKTALLACVRNEAHAQGWISASATAIPGMLEELYEQARYMASNVLDDPPSRHLSSVSIGPVSAGWERGDAPGEGWRMRMTRLLDALGECESGLLITVDEVQGDFAEMVQLAAAYQHFVTEGRRVSLVMAGLPTCVHQLLGNKNVSFLRRASQHRVGRILTADVSYALRATSEDAGKIFDDRALSMCARATDGFAYMIQLVGYRTWMESAEHAKISPEDARRGIASARQDLEERVLLQTYRELSAGDVRFARAMLDDPGDSRLSDVAKRMGVSAGYASTYKSRLLAAGVIGERGRGLVGFDLPGFKDLLLKLPQTP